MFIGCLHKKVLGLRHQPLCRPDGAVFGAAGLLVGVSPPWGCFFVLRVC
jgi:hypothetical protein